MSVKGTILLVIVAVWINQSIALRCHDCTQKTCDRLIQKNLGGKCQTKEIGKCFIRQDPNGLTYRGCADQRNWPKLDHNYVGCRMQKYGMWGDQEVLWCFCEFDLCNINATYVTHVYGGSRPTPAPSQGVKSIHRAEQSGIVEQIKTRFHDQQQFQQQHHQQQQPSQPDATPNANPMFDLLLPFIRNQKNDQPQTKSDYVPQPRPDPQPLPEVHSFRPIQVPQQRPPQQQHNQQQREPQTYPAQRPVPQPDRPRPQPRPVPQQRPVPQPRPAQQPRPAPRPRPAPQPRPAPKQIPIQPRLVSHGKHNFPNIQQHPNFKPEHKRPHLFSYPEGREGPGKIYAEVLVPAPIDIAATSSPLVAGGGLLGRTGRLANRKSRKSVKSVPGGKQLPEGKTDGGNTDGKNPKSVDTSTKSPLSFTTESTTGPDGKSGGNVTPSGKSIKSGGDGIWVPNIPGFDWAKFLQQFAQNKGKKSDGDVKTCGAINQCSHQCDIINNEVTCSCRDGYILQQDSRTCRDVNECSIHNGACTQLCVNTPGAYYCACVGRGYKLQEDGKTCLDVNECQKDNGGCFFECENTLGSYKCHCPAGYKLETDARTCTDYNECKFALDTVKCDQTCINTAGSYTCGCEDGYILNPDGRSCDDYDECSERNHGCKHFCINTRGAYRCACMAGYKLGPDGKSCVDFNECIENNGGCSQNCVNTAGGFECQCKAGFTLNVDGKTCNDVDECLIKNGGCSQRCENVLGSYQCGCNIGFQLESNKRTCKDVDECGNNNGGCSQICTNEVDGYRCSCRPGYTLLIDGTSCSMVDACVKANGGCEQVCSTTSAGRRCSCNIGYLLSVDGVSCREIPSFIINMDGIQGDILLHPEKPMATVGNPTLVPSPNKLALRLDGTNQYVDAGPNLTSCQYRLDNCKSGFTTRLLSRTDDIINNGYIISCPAYDIFYKDGRMVAEYRTPTKKWEVSTDNVKLGPWQTFECSWDPSNGLSMYVNGVLVDIQRIPIPFTGNYPSPSQSSDLYIGRRNQDSGKYPEIDIDKIELWEAKRDLLKDPFKPAVEYAIFDMDEIDNGKLTEPGYRARAVNSPSVISDSGEQGIKLDSNKNQYIDFGKDFTYADNLDDMDDGYTLRMRVKPNELEDQIHFISCPPYDVYYEDGKLKCDVRTPGKKWTLSTDNFKAGEFQDIDVSWDPKLGASLYIDGRLVDTDKQGSVSSEAYIATDPTYIGRYKNNDPTKKNADMVIGYCEFYKANRDWLIANGYLSQELDYVIFDMNEIVNGKLTEPGYTVRTINSPAVAYEWWGQGVTLDSSQFQYIDFGKDFSFAENLNSYDNGYTLRMRLKPNELEDNIYFVSCPPYDLYYKDGKLNCDLRTRDRKWTLSTSNFKAGEFQDIDVSWDPNRGAFLYIDGQLVDIDTGSYNNAPYIDTDGTYIGRYRIDDPSKKYADMVIDYCEFYKAYREWLVENGILPEDVNECDANNGGCRQLCINTLGSYRCGCADGYDLDVDGRTCNDLNECSVNNGGCSQGCENINGARRCVCRDGYTLAKDGVTCDDIDECAVDNGGCEDQCTNTQGSFECQCLGDLWRVSSDGRSCTGRCPTNFIKIDALESCYRVYTKEEDTRSVVEAEKVCKDQHPLADLVKVETDNEKNFLASILAPEPPMLQGWQGWWTSGKYRDQLAQFQWGDNGFIDNDSPNWGFKKTPFVDTCVWILQINVYNYTWANYDCNTVSGFICEIDLPRKKTPLPI